MNIIFNWGYDFTFWLNTLPERVSTFFSFFQLFSRDLFFLSIIPLILWCINKSFGKRLIILTSLSAYMGSIISTLFYTVEPAITNLKTGMVFISGSTLPVTAFWGLLISKGRLIIGRILSVLLLILILSAGIINNSLYFQDVLVSAVAALIIVILFIKLEKSVANQYNAGLNILQRVLTTLIIGIVFLIIAIMFVDKELNKGIIAVALFTGSTIGLILEKEYLDFSVKGSIEIRLARYFLGMFFLAVIFILFSQLELITGSQVVVFIKYLITSFTGTFVLPFIFIRLKLAEKS